MLVIGILGGIASGKSLVSQQFCELGAELLDADRAGHEVLKEEKVKELVRKRWGDAVFDKNGWIDRPALAKIVFEPSSEIADTNLPTESPLAANNYLALQYLESITHPRISLRLKKQIETSRQQHNDTVLILDAPVMLKAGWDRMCGHLVYVEASQEARMERAKQRGWSHEDFLSRERAQEPLSVKRNLADWIVDNSTSIEAAQRQTQEVWESIRSNFSPPSQNQT